MWTVKVRGTPSLVRDEQALLDAIELAERRADAKILRDVQLALPEELGTAALADLVREFAQWVANEYGTLAMWAIHGPGRLGDWRNMHAHILVPTRKVDALGEAFGPKIRQLDDFRTGPAEICKIRNKWCELANKRLKRVGSAARIHAGRRLDAPPMPTIPRRFVARAYAAKRKVGLATEPMRVAELADLGEPDNDAMARIAAHVKAGYDVRDTRPIYEEEARPYYERAREHDDSVRDASYYEGLRTVGDELTDARAELDALEARIEGLDAALAPGPPAPESVVVVPTPQIAAPPALEDDQWAREPALGPVRDVVLDVDAEPVAPAPVAVVAVRSIAAPPALEDDEWAREPALAPGRGLVLDVDAEPALPAPVAVVAVRPIAAPPALEDDEWAREPALAPGRGLVLDVDAEPALPVPVAVVAVRPIAAPPALEDDEWAREPALASGRGLVLDVDAEPALPAPVSVVSARAVVAPLALEDEDEALEHEFERCLEQVERRHNNLEVVETMVARELSEPDWFAATIEEFMRGQVRDAPQWEPRLADVPRDAEANQFGVTVWRVVLHAEMDVLHDCGQDRERIERHISNVRKLATTDAHWRSEVVAGFGASISPSYFSDLDRAGYFDRDRDRGEDAMLERLIREGGAGGLDAWSEQSVARAAGLEVDHSFGQWSRSRASGLLAEEVLRLHLHDAVRTARRLKRTFPGECAPEPGRPTTLREWHGRVAGLISDVRERLREPTTREGLITDLALRMQPDLRLEWTQGSEGVGRGAMPEAAPPTPVERDRTLDELVRARGRNAGIEDDRTRLRLELDAGLERMVEEICLFGPRSAAASGELAPDGAPAHGQTARALTGELEQRFGPGLDHIRAVQGTSTEPERRRDVLKRCHDHLSDEGNRHRVLDGLVAAAGAHYETEWLPPLESADPRGAREREELRTELEAQLRTSAEAAGEARLLNHAGITVEVPLRGAVVLDKLLDDGEFAAGLTYRRPEREPVRRAVTRWREHCETHLDDVAAMLLEAMWPDRWEQYRTTRLRSKAQPVPSRDERDQVVLDATRPAEPTSSRRTPAPGRDDEPGY